MDSSSGCSEKDAKFGYLTQASVGWNQAPRLSFNPIMCPPSFSIPGTLRSLLKEIDRLPQSETRSIRYRLLVEELCAYVEDVDQEKQLGIESKLVKLVERLGLQEAESARKTSNDHSSKIPNNSKELPPWKDSQPNGQREKEDVISPITTNECLTEHPTLDHGRSDSPVNQSTPILATDTFGLLDDSPTQESVKSPVQAGSFAKNNMNDFGKSLTRALDLRPQKTPVSTNIPRTSPRGDLQVQIPQKPSHRQPPPLNSGSLVSKVNSVSQNQQYSARYPQLETFRELFKPIVVRYPQLGQVSREELPFYIIDSAACQLGFKSYWNGLSFSQAEEVWKLGICVSSWLIGIAKYIPDAEVFPGQSKDLVWPLYSCPKQLFMEMFRDIYIQATETAPTWAHSDNEIDQFLGTCSAFHTLQTAEDPKGVYAPGFDSYNRIYCMYALQPDSTPKDIKLRHFMRQIVVPVEQIDIISGEKVTITPTLWDPHKPYDVLRKHTKFTMNPPLLDWDEDTKNFTGIIKVVTTNGYPTDVYCVLEAYTIEDLPKGVSYETKVEASVTLRVRIPGPKERESEIGIPEIHTAVEEADDLWESDSDSDSESVESLEIHVTKSTDIDALICSSFIESTISDSEDELDPIDETAVTISPDTTSTYAGMSPIFKQQNSTSGRINGVHLQWDSKQYLSITCIENPEEFGWESAESDDGSNDKSDEGTCGGFGHEFCPASGCLSDMNFLSKRIVQGETIDPFSLDEDSRGTSREQTITGFSEDDIDQVEYEGYNLVFNLKIELGLTKAGGGVRVSERIAAFIRNLPNIKSVPDLSRRLPGLRSIGLPMKSSTVKDDHGRQGYLVNLMMGTEEPRGIHWRKMILPRILSSLTRLDNEVESVFTACMEIRKRGDYTFRDIRRIAKAIMLYGDLLDYTRIMRDETPAWSLPPDFGSSRHNPYSKNFSVSEHINSIDEALTPSEVIEIMNPEMYGVEEYRFNFRGLREFGTIKLTQSFPLSCADLATRWNTGILNTISAAMEVEDSNFIEFAKAPESWQSFELFLANDVEGIRQLNKRREEAQKDSEACFIRGEENWTFADL